MTEPASSRIYGLALIVFAATLGVYLLTMPRSITLEDAGLFQMVCHLGGIAHPPGYPLFTSICQAVVPLFPTGVFAGNLLSALFAALACVFFFFCMHRVSNDASTAAIAALAYGFSAAFWSQAIIIEVYTLAVLGFVVCWWTLLRYTASGDSRWLFLTSFLFGLALTNHWPLMLLAAPALLLVPAGSWPVFLNDLKSPQFWIIATGLFLLGLTPYLSILTKTDPTIALLGEINSLEQLAGYIARSAYSDHHVIADGGDRLQYMLWLAEESGSQLGMMALPFILAGIVVCFRALPLVTASMFLLLFLGATFVLSLLTNFSYEYLYRAVFKPYPVISYLAVAAWFAFGVRAAGSLIRRISTETKWLPSGFSIALLTTVLLANFPDNRRNQGSWVDSYGRQLLASLPPGSVFFAMDDLEVGVLGYLHEVEGLRPDVELRNWENLVFANRLRSPLSDPGEQQAAMRTFMETDDRPVFASSLPIHPREERGAYFQYTPDQAPSVARNPAMGPVLDDLLDLYIGGLITDPHDLHYAYLRLVSFTRQYVGLAVTGHEMSSEELERLQRLQSTFPGRLTTLEVLLPLNNVSAKAQLMSLALAAEADIPAVAPRASAGLLYEYLGRISMMEPADNNAAMAWFEKSIAVNPTPDNTSHTPLALLKGG